MFLTTKHIDTFCTILERNIFRILYDSKKKYYRISVGILECYVVLTCRSFEEEYRLNRLTLKI
jgi:hypothetical protein